MADINQWLHALFSPNSAYGGQTAARAAPVAVAPATRAGNTYKGQALPTGVSSLLASSEDSRGKRAVKEKPSGVVGDNRMKRLSGQAGMLLSDLFGEARNIPGVNMPRERWGDRMLDRVGFFDANGGTNQERTNRALFEWYRKLGLGPNAYTQSPFYRPTGRR